MSRLTFILVLTIALFSCVQAQAQQPDSKPIRIGIIGLDTSHVTAFTKLLNDPNAKGDLAGLRVVAGFPGGSPDIASSRERIKGFNDTLRDKMQVEIGD